MTIRFKEESGEHRIKEVTELEIEGAWECKASGGKWVLLNGFEKLKMIEPLDRAVVFLSEVAE